MQCPTAKEFMQFVRNRQVVTFKPLDDAQVGSAGCSAATSLACWHRSRRGRKAANGWQAVLVRMCFGSTL